MTARRAVSTTGPAHALDPSVIDQWVQRTCRAQGIAVPITDRAVIARVVALLGASDGRHNHTRPGT